MTELLYAYYGDDFTGSTDVLESLAEGGIPAVLFVVPPTAALLRRFPDARAIGLAGDSRSRTPAWMDAELPRLFASAGHDVHRIDRHPTMRCHPVTPMGEADLRRHLADQTNLAVGLVGLDCLKAGQGAAAFDEIVAGGAAAVLFDGIDEETLREAGRLIWQRAGLSVRFAVGSSGVTRALIEAWRAAGVAGIATPPPEIPAVDRLLVVSGSCSPVTASQIEWALAHGYQGIKADVVELLAGSEAERARIESEALAAAESGASPLIYSATGPLAPGAEASGDRLGAALGRVARNIVARGGPRRILFAGGDTSSHAVAQLCLYALTWAGATERGAPLCRGHAEDCRFDGLELVLKGGQIGSRDFFDRVRRGNVAA